MPASASCQDQTCLSLVLLADNLLAAWREWAQLPPPRFGEIAAPEPLPYDLRQAQALRAVSAEAQPGRIWLQLSADATLPPIPCPLSAVAQSGELQRLLEVAGEATAGCGSSSHGGLEAAGEPELLLPLAGVSAEEHAALGALVGCLAGCTHAGLLEATQLLDVARWGAG